MDVLSQPLTKNRFTLSFCIAASFQYLSAAPYAHAARGFLDPFGEGWSLTGKYCRCLNK